VSQRKPPKLKALAGTGRTDREASNVSSLLPKLEVVPSPPDWLTDPAAVREWANLAPLLVACGVLRATMVSSLGHLCQLHAALLAGGACLSHQYGRVHAAQLFFSDCIYGRPVQVGRRYGRLVARSCRRRGKSLPKRPGMKARG